MPTAVSGQRQAMAAQPVSRSAGQLWVIVGHGFLMAHKNPHGKKPSNKKRQRAALWVTVGSVGSTFKSLRLESITCAVYFLM